MHENDNLSNTINIRGTITEEFYFSHESHGEQIYTGTVSVKRISDTYDNLNIMISSRVADLSRDWLSKKVNIRGQIRSWNSHSESGKNQLVLSLFVLSMEETANDSEDINEAELFGTICKPPVYRTTPTGREICDLFIAVNRDYSKKADYIPCIVWGRNARWVSGKSIGDKIRIFGRFQSREYDKKMGENFYEHRVAYEFSVSAISEDGNPVDTL